MSITLLLKRGTRNEVRQLAEGELGFITNERRLMIGSNAGNVELAQLLDDNYFVGINSFYRTVNLQGGAHIRNGPLEMVGVEEQARWLRFNNNSHWYVGGLISNHDEFEQRGMIIDVAREPGSSNFFRYTFPPIPEVNTPGGITMQALPLLNANTISFDLNDYVRTGIYAGISTSANNWKNTPLGSLSGTLHVYNHGLSRIAPGAGTAHYCMQVFYGVSSGAVYIYARTCTNGTWNAWRRIITSEGAGAGQFTDSISIVKNVSYIQFFASDGWQASSVWSNHSTTVQDGVGITVNRLDKTTNNVTYKFPSITEANSGANFNAVPIAAIPATAITGTNLNNYTRTGVYPGISSTYTNVPEALNGTLVVLNSTTTTGGYLQQCYHTNNAAVPRVWIRSQINGTWNAWLLQGGFSGRTIIATALAGNAQSQLSISYPNTPNARVYATVELPSSNSTVVVVNVVGTPSNTAAVLRLSNMTSTAVTANTGYVHWHVESQRV